MKKIATFVLATVMIVLGFSAHTAYACECECSVEEQQAVESGEIDSWENIMYETYNIYFPLQDFFFQNVYVEDLDDKKVIEMGTFSFLIELTEDNRLLIEFYPPGDMGASIDPSEYIQREEAIQLGSSDVYAWGYWDSVSYLHTGEMLFEITIDEDFSQTILIYETPYGWTLELVQFEEEPFT